MIAQKYRFKGRAGLNPVYKHGQTFRSPNFSVRVYQNNKNINFRIAVVVSKKTAKLAVTRNLIRRQIYEVIRKNQTQINSSFDIVFTVFSDTVADLPAHELERQILKILNQAKVIN